MRSPDGCGRRAHRSWSGSRSPYSNAPQRGRPPHPDASSPSLNVPVHRRVTGSTQRRAHRPVRHGAAQRLVDLREVVGEVETRPRDDLDVPPHPLDRQLAGHLRILLRTADARHPRALGGRSGPHRWARDVPTGHGIPGRPTQSSRSVAAAAVRPLPNRGTHHDDHRIHRPRRPPSAARRDRPRHVRGPGHPGRGRRPRRRPPQRHGHPWGRADHRRHRRARAAATGTSADMWSLVDPEDVRWVFLSHDDVDHYGNLGPVMEACPNATLLTSWFQWERLGNLPDIAPHRMRWLEPNDSFEANGRTYATCGRRCTTRRPPGGCSTPPPACTGPATASPPPCRTGWPTWPSWPRRTGSAPATPTPSSSARGWPWSTGRSTGPRWSGCRRLGITTIASCHSPTITGDNVERAFQMLRDVVDVAADRRRRARSCST